MMAGLTAIRIMTNITGTEMTPLIETLQRYIVSSSSPYNGL
jgi:hypothetical protein